MADLLQFLSASGDIGVWVLILVTWKFHDRLLRIEMNVQSHNDMDKAEFKRVNHRLDALECDS